MNKINKITISKRKTKFRFKKHVIYEHIFILYIDT